MFNEESKDEPSIATLDELGTADKIIISKDNTVIIGGGNAGSDSKEQKVSSLKELYESTDDRYDKMRYKAHSKIKWRYCHYSSWCIFTNGNA